MKNNHIVGKFYILPGLLIFFAISFWAANQCGAAPRTETPWVNETLKIMDRLIKSRGYAYLDSNEKDLSFALNSDPKFTYDNLIALGTPFYKKMAGDLITNKDTNGRSNPKAVKLIIKELSALVPFGGVDLSFEENSKPRAKKVLIEASEIFPARFLRIIEKEGAPILASDFNIGLENLFDNKSYFIAGNYYSIEMHILHGRYVGYHEMIHAVHFALETYGYGTDMVGEFYDHRAKDSFLNKMLFNVSKSGFLHYYMGHNDREMLATLITMIMWNQADIWRGDPECVKFGLGFLVYFGTYWDKYYPLDFRTYELVFAP